jgi:hypothetical protein
VEEGLFAAESELEFVDVREEGRDAVAPSGPGELVGGKIDVLLGHYQSRGFGTGAYGQVNE